MPKETNKQLLNDKLGYVRLAEENCEENSQVHPYLAFMLCFIAFFASYSCRPILIAFGNFNPKR